jgi:RNase P subunit RPR2
MKKVNFLGVEFNVAEQADIDQAAEAGEQHRYIVVRVADMNPQSGSPDLRRRRRRTQCEICNALCWYDPKSLDALRGMNLVITCTQCELVRLRAERELLDFDG